MPLLLQIERGDFVANFGQLLGGGKSERLRLPQRFLGRMQGGLDGLHRFLFGSESIAVLNNSAAGFFQIADNNIQFLLGHGTALFGLGDLGQSFAVLRGDLRQSFLVVLNAVLMAIDFRFQFHPAVLHPANLGFQFRKQPAQLRNFVLGLQGLGAVILDLLA